MRFCGIDVLCQEGGRPEPKDRLLQPPDAAAYRRCRPVPVARARLLLGKPKLIHLGCPL